MDILDSRVSKGPPNSGALPLGDFQKEYCVRLGNLISLPGAPRSLVAVPGPRTPGLMLPANSGLSRWRKTVLLNFMELNPIRGSGPHNPLDPENTCEPKPFFCLGSLSPLSESPGSWREKLGMAKQGAC